jgi:tRNA(fMet)-specific endonuclease VapC
MIFLDTNIISYYLAADERVTKKVLEAVCRDGGISTTIINVYEILKGFRWKNNKKKEKMFKAFLSNVEVFAIDDEVVDIASAIYAKLRKGGKNIEDADILIAAITIKNRGTLVSNNIKHYEGIERLSLENWI